jgi:hypothetical protein
MLIKETILCVLKMGENNKKKKMKVEGSIGIVFMLYASACHSYSFLINIHIEILVQL